MPPILATVVYLGFIYWLLRRHAKDAEGVSRAIWIPFIWVGIRASRMVVFWLASGSAASASADASDGNAIDRNIDLILLASAMVVLARRPINWPVVTRECRWLIIFYLYLLLSTLWSDYTFISFKRWVRDGGDMVMVLVLLTETDPIEAFRWVFLRCSYVLIPLSTLFVKYYPDLGRYYNTWTWEAGFCGATNNKNSLGLLAMWSGLILLWQIMDVHRRGRPMTLRQLWPDLVVLSLSLWLLHLARSSTSLACFILGTVILFGSRLRVAKANLKNVEWCFAAIAAVMLLMTLNSGFRAAVAGALGRDADLTNRTEIWDWALHLGINPLVGSGFSSALLTYADDPFMVESHLSHVHNGYLQTYVDSGLIGVFLLLAILYSAGRNAVRQLTEHSAVGHLFLALFFSCLFYNYTEVAFDRSNAVGFLVWIMAAYGVAANAPAHQTETTAKLTDDCNPVPNGI